MALLTRGQYFSTSPWLGVCCRRFSATPCHRNHYETLGVSRTATAKDIKAAYFALSKKHHPDVAKNGGSSDEMFIKITAAYDVLGDKDKRAGYDRRMFPNPSAPPESIYRKQWANMPPGQRPMHDPDRIHRRVVETQKLNQREKYIRGLIVVGAAFSVGGVMLALRLITYQKSKSRADYQSIADDFYWKNQQRYSIGSLGDQRETHRSKSRHVTVRPD